MVLIDSTKSPLLTQTTRAFQTDRQTDGNAISIVEHLPRNARWVVDFICCITRGSIHCGSVESHYLPIEV